MIEDYQKNEISNSKAFEELRRYAEALELGVRVPLTGYGRQQGVAAGFWGDGWTSSAFEVAILVEERLESLVVQGYLPAHFEEITLSISINGVELSQQILQPGRFSVPVTAQAEAGELLKLRITSDRSYCPALAGENDDKRELVLRLEDIRLHHALPLIPTATRWWAWQRRRLLSRSHKIAPSSIRPKKLIWPSSSALEAALGTKVSKQQGAAFLDRFQALAFERLSDQYGDVLLAKLLALRLTNLAAARYHFANRHTVLISHPLQLLVDPANACQLGCPACVHSTNERWAGLFDWPALTLSVDTYDAFLDTFAPFAFAASLVNYGEPLLHKRFDAIVRSSKEWLLYTITSTNLSMPLNNTEAIVASGLDYMILSIDGTTQAVYERYRRKGDLGLVLENVRKLVAAKRRAGTATPYLVWQFLTFEHNQHQTEEAIRMAREIGVNEVKISTPFEVDADEPSIRAVKSGLEGSHIFQPWDEHWFIPSLCAGIKNRAGAIEAAFSKSWQVRLRENLQTDSAAPEAGTCWWLYYNMTLDGAGRIMPCCMAPDKNEKKLVFANFKAGQKTSPLEIINSPMAAMARESFSDRRSYEKRAASYGPNSHPYCAKCSENPASPYMLRHVRRDIRMIDSSRAIPDDIIHRLTDWR